MNKLPELVELPERQKVMVELAQTTFRELEQTHKHAETNFEAAEKLLRLKEYRAAMRCFEDAGFYLNVLSRRYDHLAASLRRLREYSIVCADRQEQEEIADQRVNKEEDA